ncbi:MAG TPA: glycine zipper domain-containing protein [Planctomycetaceae bacterium]|nr:glycine zipper domain-containing protein [Planctomycetaceae bacterium]
MTSSRLLWGGLGLVLLGTSGCYSPYYADRGALVGGLTGAGVGAALGEAAGNPLAGAVIGAGVGTLTGAAVGSSLDEIEARNRAQIAAQMGRPVREGAVTTQEVVAMSQAGVDEGVIVRHVQINGVAQPLQSNDIIALQTAGVSPKVIQAMQQPPIRRVAVGPPPPPPVIVQPYFVSPFGPPPPPAPLYGF